MKAKETRDDKNHKTLHTYTPTTTTTTTHACRPDGLGFTENKLQSHSSRKALKAAFPKTLLPAASWGGSPGFQYFFTLALLGLCLAVVPQGTDVPFFVESSPGNAHSQMGPGTTPPLFFHGLLSRHHVGPLLGKLLGSSPPSGKSKLLRQALLLLRLTQGPSTDRNRGFGAWGLLSK